MTFAALAEAFLSRPAAARQRTADEIRKTVGRYLLPRWGSRDAASITRADAITMVEDLDRASGPYTAAKALALASSIFRHAMTREQIASNPCTLIKITDFVGDMAPRQRVLTDAEIGLLWRATEDIYPAGPFARLLLLTAVRRSEAAHMTWGEVNLDDALWVVPASRTKSGVPHEVPLSRHGHRPAAVAPSLHRRRLRVLDHRRPQRHPQLQPLQGRDRCARHRADQLALPRSATDRAHQSGIARRLAVHRRADPRPSRKRASTQSTTFTAIRPRSARHWSAGPTRLRDIVDATTSQRRRLSKRGRRCDGREVFRRTRAAVGAEAEDETRMQRLLNPLGPEFERAKSLRGPDFVKELTRLAVMTKDERFQDAAFCSS